MFRLGSFLRSRKCSFEKALFVQPGALEGRKIFVGYLYNMFITLI
ncbi:hypothetical protein HMPREF3038_03271 [Akkermansia sp. KLE1797]|nr:hypothetical protein HMPREF3038_03271 [Akkermansia sp. KLE1797]KXU55115.1 hypothetical protein HMPREF3039_00668 [Akkermansia sp. KLE1798]KZA06142.1 hypothetical protein HMPREF1326_00181 [Akkermansia sp. KLE1605]